MHVIVDNSGEIFGDKVSIADLAQYSFKNESKDTLHIYRADQILSRDWRDELVSVEMEYALGVSATFKDGSVLRIGAPADCCRPGNKDYGNCHWCGGRY